MEQSANPAARVGHYTWTISTSTQNVSVWSPTAAAPSDSVFFLRCVQIHLLTYLVVLIILLYTVYMRLFYCLIDEVACVVVVVVSVTATTTNVFVVQRLSSVVWPFSFNSFTGFNNNLRRITGIPLGPA